jgi:hypothetical protein
MIDRLRDGAAVIYLEGIYDARKPVPVPEWTTDSPPLGGGITTSRASGAPRVTVSTIVLVDAELYANRLKYQLDKMSLEFGREGEDARTGGFKFCHPDTEEGQGGQWMPLIQTGRSSVPNWPNVQGIWRVVLNVGTLEPKTVEYLNGDRFDLRAANLRLVEPQVRP